MAVTVHRIEDDNARREWNRELRSQERESGQDISDREDELNDRHR